MSVEYLLPKGPKDIPRPFLIVCEGMSDARFICSLLTHTGITTCSVGCPSGLGSGSGLDSIASYLIGIQAITKGKETLRGLLIIIDADDKPTQRFSDIQKALSNANFPMPSEAFRVEGDPFRVAVFLIPRQGENGTLDNLLLEAALKKNPRMKVCLDDFSNCTGSVKTWTPNQQSKMRLSALVAAFCQKNPWASAALMWSDKGNPVPIESECFNQITEFLRFFVGPR
jgi:hypothetical protein